MAETPTIDTSGMSEGKRAAMEMAEASREQDWKHSSFAGSLFMGRALWETIVPFPEQEESDRKSGEPFLETLESFLRDHVDPDEIDRTGEIPDEVIKQLAEMGAFGIKIPTEYGGLGLSQTNYSKAAICLGSYCGNLTALISAHQSIGVPQPLKLFGTEEQKKKFLPRVARGEISAFALTERGVGSDPAQMETRAEPAEDGNHFILNGEKLWCTNGTRAGVITVMARTPSRKVNGKERNQITAFLLDMDTPGVKVTHRCHFMGLKALYNAIITFDDVKVPRENIILGEGKGLKVALSTLNTGRLTLPAACLGLGKRCLNIVKKWGNERVQWGGPIGRHAAIADKIAKMASHIFAMESMVLLAASLVDRGNADIRMEAAVCKILGTEWCWKIVDETLQIRGGRGYETADSLRARGEEGLAVERFLRDCRINLIFEGSSEIMRLFLAREALDPHLKAAGGVISKGPLSGKISAAMKASGFYARWYPLQWIPTWNAPPNMHSTLASHAAYVSQTARVLARRFFHSMARHGPKLEREQVLLGRLVDVGSELFAMAATCSRAQSLLDQGQSPDEVLPLADYFLREARNRVAIFFKQMKENNDRAGYRLAQSVLEGKFNWLEKGMVE